MLGWDIEGHETPGQLVEMDLSEAKIVEGGSSYYGSRYTRRDTLDYGMFLHCSKLQRIVLPHSLKVIEKDAFKGCSGLISMTIPDSLVVYKTSSGCSALQELSVSPLNTVFSSIDGVLYNKDASILIHYPEGKTAEEFTFPSSVRKIRGGGFPELFVGFHHYPRIGGGTGRTGIPGFEIKKDRYFRWSLYYSGGSF